jgi:hypothetical protein
MSEIIPPSEPQKMPEMPSTQIDPPPNPPNFWSMFGLGVLLVIISCILCAPFKSPLPFGVGAFIALISLCFQGYRGIFIGFLTTIGVVLLGAAVICGAMLSGMH